MFSTPTRRIVAYDVSGYCFDADVIDFSFDMAYFILFTSPSQSRLHFFIESALLERRPRRRYAMAAESLQLAGQPA